MARHCLWHQGSIWDQDAGGTDSAPFYKYFELKCTLPGPSELHCELCHTSPFCSDAMFCSTSVDLENRWFHPKWRQSYHERPPEETRSLRKLGTTNVRGTLRIILELLTESEARERPPLKIEPFPTIPFELRIVVWETKGVPSGDFGYMSDMYVRAWLPGHQPHETDIHWRAKEGVGSFNWRMKFPVMVPMENVYQQLFLQVWDSDPTNLLKPRDLRGEATFSLHDVLNKAYRAESTRRHEAESTKTAVRQGSSHGGGKQVGKDTSKFAKGQTPESMQEYALDSFYERFPMLRCCRIRSHDHPDCHWVPLMLYDEESGERHESGSVSISIYCVTDESAKRQPVGSGRSDPNCDPILQPPAGRISAWSWWNPYNMIYDLCGSRFARRIAIIFLVTLLYYIGQWASGLNGLLSLTLHALPDRDSFAKP